MKISMRMIAEQLGVDFDSKLRPHLPELRQKLPLAGLEIGAVSKPGEVLKSVQVALVESTAPHPNADRLKVCQVKTAQETLQIVCGAPNVKAQMKVALAPVDCVLPGGLKIKKSAIRGVESSGMLCSASELGLSSESDGLLELPASAAVGGSLVKALGLDDELWDIELTPDRGDCLSHRGMAREIGRFLGLKVQDLELEELGVLEKSEVPLLRVENLAPKHCLIYGALLLDDVQNQNSTDWLKRRLEFLGQRSKSTVVDLTNLVLLETGHPLHAFDADLVAGQKILVRFAKPGERLKTLDGVDRVLTSDDLVIADLEKPMALAGVMGGLETAVSPGTKRVILECAVFDPLCIRSMVARHKLHTDSSLRFERGVDSAYRRKTMGRATLLLKQLCGARRRGSVTEIGTSEKTEKNSLNLDLRSFQSVVGLEVGVEELARAFESTGTTCVVKSTNVLKVEIPSHRHDLVREVDWIEEGARLLGYDRIPTRYPSATHVPESGTRTVFERAQFVRHRLLELGLAEMMPYSFHRAEDAQWTPAAHLVKLKNPLSAAFAHLRPNVTMGLVEVLRRHAALGQDRVEVFDSGHCFVSDMQEPQERGTGVREPLHAGWALMGARDEGHWSSDKGSKDRKASFGFFEGKGVATALVDSLVPLEGRWSSTQWMRLDEWNAQGNGFALSTLAPWIPERVLHPYRSAIAYWPGAKPRVVGFVGEMNPGVKSSLLNLATGKTLGVVLGELRIWESFFEEAAASGQRNSGLAGFQVGKVALSRALPVMSRDLALVINPLKTKSQDLERALRKAAGPELRSLECLDVYPLNETSHSLAFRAVFQGQDATLTESDVAAKVSAMLQAAEKNCGAMLRST